MRAMRAMRAVRNRLDARSQSKKEAAARKREKNRLIKEKRERDFGEEAKAFRHAQILSHSPGWTIAYAPRPRRPVARAAAPPAHPVA